MVSPGGSGVESTFKLMRVLTEFSSLKLRDCVAHLFSLAVSQGSLSVLVPGGGPQALYVSPLLLPTAWQLLSSKLAGASHSSLLPRPYTA